VKYRGETPLNNAYTLKKQQEWKCEKVLLEGGYWWGKGERG
jgi:hypothetical protein